MARTEKPPEKSAAPPPPLVDAAVMAPPPPPDMLEQPQFAAVGRKDDLIPTTPPGFGVRAETLIGQSLMDAQRAQDAHDLDNLPFGVLGCLVGYVRVSPALQTVGGDKPGVYDHITSGPTPTRDVLRVESMRLVGAGILVRRKGNPSQLLIPWSNVNHALPPEPAKGDA